MHVYHIFILHYVYDVNGLYIVVVTVLQDLSLLYNNASHDKIIYHDVKANVDELIFYLRCRI